MTGKPDALFFSWDGHKLPITNMFDIFGEETTDPTVATSLVALLPNDRWLAVACSPREIERIKLN